MSRTTEQKEESAYRSRRQNDILGARGVPLCQCGVTVSQGRQQVRDEHVELPLYLGRPLSLWKIKDITDGPDAGVRF